MTLVAPLRAFGRNDLATAGGKGANLGELVRHGFPVPDGFVVTTGAYATVLTAAGIDIAARLDADGGSVRSEIEKAPIPDALQRAILEAYRGLGSGPVAVRSSATAEDLPGAAFAGQQDTYLNIVGEEAVLDAVRRCWGSLWSERAIAYRRRLRIDPEEVRIAVVVQRLVEAETAGVMFTANPVTGARDDVIVDASTGLGEAVVSGAVTPDHYVLAPDGTVRSWTPGRREVVIVAVAGGGVDHVAASDDQSDQCEEHRPLPDHVLRRLAELGTGLARHFGRPQDIEWAYAEGRVWLVQARPMTALPPPPLKLNPLQRKTGSILLDYLPIRPYPIDMTTWVPYGPVGLMAKVTRRFGVRSFENFLVEEDGVVTRLVPPTPRPTLRVLTAPFRMAARVRRFDPARWTEDPRFDDYVRRMRRLADRDLAALPWHELLRVPREVFALVGVMIDLRTDYLPGSGVALVRLHLALARLGVRSLAGDLILGAHTRTEDANRALEHLAARVREHPTLQQAFATLDADALLPVVEADAAFSAEFGDFLREYGHRETSSPILVTPPTWSEAPEAVLGLVKMLAAAPPSTETRERADRAMSTLLEHRKVRHDPRHRERLRRRVEAARAGVAFREDSHFYFTQPLPVLRRALLELGARLVGVGVLDAVEEVFHLRLEELEGIGDVEQLAEADRERLRNTARARAAKRDELAGVRLIDPRAIFPAQDDGDALVVGTSASAGTVTGRVRVVRGAADFGTLQSGEILVCPYTNPSWTPLFQRAAAVVVDSGGPASHAAIVAREYGLPAVMGTADGTSVLTDGMLVTVDGDRGRVTAAPPAQGSAGS